MISDKSTLSGTSASPRRIAFCITELDPGGAEKALVQLVTRLNRHQWEPRIYCLGPETQLAEMVRHTGVPVTCYGAKSWKDLGVFSWLTRELRTFRPELLQCFLFHANLAGRIAGRRTNVPVIISGHRVAERQKTWHLWLDRLTRRMVDQHVCVSRGVAEHVASSLGISPQKITVIPNGVEVDPCPPATGSLQAEFRFPESAPVILAAGRLHPQKGFLMLLDAFHLIAQSHPTVQLLIVGEGPQRAELEQRIKQLGLVHRSRLPGHRMDILNIMRQARIFALTSQWEGMPNVVLEAMACGLPVVAMDVEGIRDIIVDQHHGSIIKPGDIRRFAATILHLLDHPEEAGKLASAAQHLVQNQFTWDLTTRNYEQLYQRLID